LLATADYAAMTKRRRRFSERRLPILGRIAAILAVLLGLTSAAPGGPLNAAHVDEASLVAATQEICALSNHASDSGHRREGSGCCCLQATMRRDATFFIAILRGIVEFAAPDTSSFAARADATRRAGVALPTTPWLSRAPPSFS
jgi:hypothetical protein